MRAGRTPRNRRPRRRESREGRPTSAEGPWWAGGWERGEVVAWVMASRGMERKEEKRRGGERGEREGVRGRVATLFHLGHFPEYDQHTQGSHGDRMVGGRRVRGSPSRRGGEGTGGGASPGFEQAFFLTPSSAARRSPPMLTVPAGAAAADREPRTARAAMRRVERRDAIVAGGKGQGEGGRGKAV